MNTILSLNEREWAALVMMSGHFDRYSIPTPQGMTAEIEIDIDALRERIADQDKTRRDQ